MKTFYLMGLVAGLIWLGLGMFISFAVPAEEGLASRLHREPEKWELRIKEESAFLKKEDEGKYKELLETFIAKNQAASADKREHYALMIGIACIFCLAGWLRERGRCGALK